jgi:putative ABC transport system permease protein
MKQELLKDPPRLTLKLLRWFCSDELIEDVEGDLSELYTVRAETNKGKAKRLFFRDVMMLFRPGIIKTPELFKTQNNMTMLNNYLKIAWRNAIRYKGYSLLNIFGLVIGIASSVLVLLWVQDEVGIDKFHKNGDTIYQVFRNMKQNNGEVNTTQSLPKPVGDLVNNDYSEVEGVTWMSWRMEARFNYGEDSYEEVGRYANPEFLNMFSFEVILGDKSTALNELNSVMISRNLAERLFGLDWTNEILGEIVEVVGQPDIFVTGVFENIGNNSSITFDWLAPAQAYFNANDWVNDWGNGSFNTYISIPDEAKVKTVADRLLMEIMTHTVGNPNAGDEELIIQKFGDTYLYSNFKNGVVAGGRIDYVRIMTVVAIFILIVACINFMNLTTARSSRRSKEIGLRKVMGAERKAIRTQFYIEAILFTALAMAVSIIIVVLLLPSFNNLVEKELTVDISLIETWYFIIGMTLTVGIISGSYPALILPRIDLLQSMKGGVKQSSFASLFRKGLVVFQFAISTLLIIGTAVVYKQIGYVLNKDLGLDKENVVAISMQGNIASKLEAYKAEILRIPEVVGVTAASGNPLNSGRSTSSADWEGKAPDEGYEVNVILSDQDFITTMGMEILKGRGFSQELEDSTNFIINEVAASIMGFDDPLQKDLSFWGTKGKIIGVVKNFHMDNLYNPIAPLIISCVDYSRSSVLLTRISGNQAEVMLAIEAITKELNPEYDFEYQFLDQAYAENYQSERTLSTLARLFALISLIISNLGLLGLASYSAEQRAREIGVRKVHGASIMQILLLLSKDYSRLIFIAFIIAMPFGYYVTNGWLNNFEFRTNLGVPLFLLAGLTTFVIGVITVASKSYQAASTNPVNSLKEE